MLKTRGMKASALGLLLAAVAVGTVDAQQPEPQYLAMGLLTVGTGEAILVNASHDDHSQAPPAIVQINLFDQQGALVKTRLVTLAPGQSATLAHRASGRFRPQLVIINPPPEPSSRRAIVGCAEITRDDFTTVNRITCAKLPERQVPVGP